MANVPLGEISTLQELTKTLRYHRLGYGQTDKCTLTLRSAELEFIDFSIILRSVQQTSPSDMDYQIIARVCNVMLNNALLVDAAYIRLTEDSDVLELLEDEDGMRIIFTSAAIELVTQI